MYIKKYLVLFILISCFWPYANADNNIKIRWTSGIGNSLSQSPSFYGTSEAKRIADNVLLYQRSNGGWQKNYDRAKVLNPTDHPAIAKKKSSNDTTIDNGATYAEVQFLARVYQATHTDKYKSACLRGIQFLLNAQYPNGGWPQYYPIKRGYSSHITFNDNAMIGVMRTLELVARDRQLFNFVTDDIRQHSETALKNGLDCILKCQIVVNGKKTAWCAQHDEVTLLPAKARSYELASISGSESVGVVRYLMSIDKPSPQIIAAINSAVQWFNQSKLQGIKVVTQQTPTGKDRVVINDPAAPPLWARFYDLKTNQPIFCSRDGIPRAHLKDISFERRNGYSWLGNYPSRLLQKEYPLWLKKHQ